MGNDRISIMSLIHNNNHNRYRKIACINELHEKYLINPPGFLKFPKVFRNIDAGLYKLVFAECPDEAYLLNVYCPVGPGQTITIYSLDHVIYNTGNRKYTLQLYKIVKPEEMYNIPDSLNTNLSMFVCIGKTEIISGEQTINNPLKLSSISELSINAKNGSKASKLNIPIRYDVKSLPNINDILVIDADNEVAYIINNIGHVILTGTEIITEVYTLSDETHCVYFIANENANHFGNKSDIFCTHFKSYDYDEFFPFIFDANGISLSNDNWRGPGFYFKIARHVAPDVESFSKLLHELYKTNKVEIFYTLAKPTYTNILLDEYHVPTFFDGTTLDSNVELSYGYKAKLKSI